MVVYMNMEVRSNIKKCAGGRNPSAATAAMEAHQPKTTAKDEELEGSSLSKRDEKLVAELKSQIPDVDNIFVIHRRIGEGTFSTVFLTSLKYQEHVPAKNKRFFALKHLIPTSHPKRVAQELRCLKDIGGKENVVGVDLCLRHNEAIAFVMPYVPHDRFHDYFDKLNARETQDYMRNLLIALRHVHRFGVIHRDVKPSNFLHDRKNQKYLLVDFGLAQSLNKEFDSTKPTGERDAAIVSGRDSNGSNYDCDTSKTANVQPPPPPPATSLAIDDNGPALSKPSPIAGNIKYKRKATEIEETENMGSVKRLRIDRDGVAGTANGPAAISSTASSAMSIESYPRSNQMRTSPYIPSPFKSPLKQVNEISTPKRDRGFIHASPMTRHIKSAVLGFSIQLAQHKRNAAAAANAIMSPVTPGDNKPKQQSNEMDTTDGSARATTVATPANSPNMVLPSSVPAAPSLPAIKYTVDNRRRGSSGGTNKCFCYGMPTVCNICIVKKDIHAPRAGTPGYRPSEVLLKYPNQTTAVDVWAAGVILISILSGCYPFFKGTDDYQALAEIITVFGDDVVRKTALTLGRHVCISHSTKIEKCNNCEQIVDDCLCQGTEQNADFNGDIFPDSVYDLLAKLLAVNPNNRISADDALEHAFFKEML